MGDKRICTYVIVKRNETTRYVAFESNAIYVIAASRNRSYIIRSRAALQWKIKIIARDSRGESLVVIFARFTNEIFRLADFRFAFVILPGKFKNQIKLCLLFF